MARLSGLRALTTLKTSTATQARGKWQTSTLGSSSSAQTAHLRSHDRTSNPFKNGNGTWRRNRRRTHRIPQSSRFAYPINYRSRGNSETEYSTPYQWLRLCFNGPRPTADMVNEPIHAAFIDGLWAYVDLVLILKKLLKAPGGHQWDTVKAHVDDARLSTAFALALMRLDEFAIWPFEALPISTKRADRWRLSLTEASTPEQLAPIWKRQALILALSRTRMLPTAALHLLGNTRPLTRRARPSKETSKIWVEFTRASSQVQTRCHPAVGRHY